MGLLTFRTWAQGSSGYRSSVSTSNWYRLPNKAWVLSQYLGQVIKRGRPTQLISSLYATTMPIVGRWSSGRVLVESLIGRVGVFLQHFWLRGRSQSCFQRLIFQLAQVGLEGFRLLSGSVITVVEGVYVFLHVVSNCKYIRVFELLAHLGVRACLAVLPRGLYYCNLLLLEGLSCLSATAFYKVFVEFLFRLSRDF